ncbi:MAG: hypothetical protein ACI308_03930 [Muribaculaceae bacterium]
MKKFTLLVAAALSLFSANAIETVAELEGTYITSISLEYTPDYKTWDSWTEKGAVTITISGENTISVSNLGNLGYEFSGTVDLENGTITLDPYFEGSYYTYCGALSEYKTDEGYGRGKADLEAPMIGTIASDGTITFNYVEASYYYTSITAIYKDELKKASAPEFSVTGHFAFYPYDEAADDYLETATLVGREATLIKYIDDDAADLGFQYELRIPDAWAGNISFSVDDSDAIALANGTEYTEEGATYQYLNTYYLWSDYDQLTLDTYDSFFEGSDATKGSFYTSAWYYPDYNDQYNYTYGKIEFAWGDYDAVTTIKADKEDENAPTFDIMGRKVTDTTAPGIYIKNGKKFIVF